MVMLTHDIHVPVNIPSKLVACFTPRPNNPFPIRQAKPKIEWKLFLSYSALLDVEFPPHPRLMDIVVADQLRLGPRV